MFGSLKPGIHCAISVRFPCDFSKVSTQTVREDRMRCNSMLTMKTTTTESKYFVLNKLFLEFPCL